MRSDMDVSVYNGVDDETCALVGGEVSAQNENDGEEEGTKRTRPLKTDKPDTLLHSWPVVVCAAVVLCFYLGELLCQNSCVCMLGQRLQMQTVYCCDASPGLEMGFAGFLSSYIGAALGAGTYFEMLPI